RRAFPFRSFWFLLLHGATCRDCIDASSPTFVDMTMSGHNPLRAPPMVLGGVGGSGTRVVAAAAIAAGFHLGHDLNEPLDNLAFTLLFKDQAISDISASAFADRVRLFADAMTGARALDPAEISLLESL